MVRIEDRLRLMIKLIFLVSVKVCAFTYLGSLYLGDLYTIVRSICIRSISIKRLSTRIDILLWEYLGFTMGDLWYEKLYPVFDKPKMYYRVKAWFISLKEQSTVGMCIY